MQPFSPVYVLDGGGGNFPATSCVTSAATTALELSGGSVRNIAAQCCEVSDGQCRRFTNKQNNDLGCIAGFSRNGVVLPTTYSEAYDLCFQRGLGMCDKPCTGQNWCEMP